MFEDFDKFWQENGFDILLGAAIGIILINYFIRQGERGTWDMTFQDPYKGRSYSTQIRNSTPPHTDSKGETECRKTLETLFRSPFPKSRPDILRNSVTSNNGTDFNLELDCYNQSLKIACEYNGAQHYKYIPYFHKTKDSFQNQKYRDYMKRDLCVKNGILLIEVPYTVKISDIQNYIITELKKAGRL
jgi:hypothetical protein